MAENATDNNVSIGKDDAFVQLTFSKNTVYENEGILATFKLYISNKISNVVHVGKLVYPEFNGFMVEDIELPKNRNFNKDIYNNKQYNTTLLRQCILFPQCSGSVTVGQGLYNMTFQVKSVNNRSAHNMFDDFFTTYENIEKQIESPEKEVNVKPFPDNPPVQFSGAAGNFQVEASIDTTTISYGDSVKITLTISGTGNIKQISPPEVISSDSYTLKTNVLKTEVATSETGVSGSKVIEYTFIPRSGNLMNITIPGFAFWDLKNRSYQVEDDIRYLVEVTGNPEETTPVQVADNDVDRSAESILANIKHLDYKKITLYVVSALLILLIIFYIGYVIGKNKKN